jgi:salicylate hydroxylase
MAEHIKAEVIVVGAGIGGLAVAHALSMAGHSVVVLEQAAAIAEIGAGIQLGPNSYKMFARLGLVNAVNGLSAFPAHLMMRDSITGEIVARIPAADEFRSRFGYPYAVIHRADLHRILLDRCLASPLVRLETGAKVVEIVQNEEKVLVRTQSDLVAEGQALIGADGIWSAVRGHIVGDGPPRPAGHIAYRSVLPTAEVPEDLRADAMCLWAGEKAHLVQYPLRGGDLYNLVAVFHSDRLSHGWNDAGNSAELETSFADKCEPVRTLLSKIDNWRMWVLNDRQPIRDWVRGRICLLGDAAHPMLQYLAQGANMAIEDAVCLVDMLANEKGDHRRAFTRYRDARYLRTARVQMTARLYGEVYHASGPVREMRNAEIGSWPVEKHYQGMNWIYGIAPTWRDDGAAEPLGDAATVSAA